MNTDFLRPKISISKPNIVNKGWGYELIISNNNKYCGKILHFNKGGKFSMHYHLIKEETFYILNGSINLYFPNLLNGSQIQKTLTKGDVIHITQGMPHQIEALEDTDVIEVSTTHYDDDNYRIIPGDSQSKK